MPSVGGKRTELRLSKKIYICPYLALPKPTFVSFLATCVFAFGPTPVCGLLGALTLQEELEIVKAAVRKTQPYPVTRVDQISNPFLWGHFIQNAKVCNGLCISAAGLDQLVMAQSSSVAKRMLEA